MTIRPRGGNLHENRWRPAAARPRVHSTRIDARCARVCAWAYKPRELANRGWITIAECAACGRQARHDHRHRCCSVRFLFVYTYIMRVYFGKWGGGRTKWKTDGCFVGGGGAEKTPTNGADSRWAREVVERTRQILAAADRNVSCSSDIIYNTRRLGVETTPRLYIFRGHVTRKRTRRTTTTSAVPPPPPLRHAECGGGGGDCGGDEVVFFFTVTI